MTLVTFSYSFTKTSQTLENKVTVSETSLCKTPHAESGSVLHESKEWSLLLAVASQTLAQFRLRFIFKRI